MEWIRKMVMKLLKIQPAVVAKQIIIKEPLSYEADVLANRLWYRGDPSELDQFFKQAATDAVTRSRFWAAVPSEDLGIRKIHSGLPGMIVGVLADLVTADLDGIELETDAFQTLWEEISTDNKFPKLLGEAIAETLVTGDGAFKITIDPDVSELPILEYFAGEHVDYEHVRGRLKEIYFWSLHEANKKVYRLRETYGKGYVTYTLYDDKDREVPLGTVPELADLVDVTYAGDFIMGVPLCVWESPKWKDRGKSLYSNKTDSFDALDEVISQWVDAIRAGRVQKYIPEDLIPRSPESGSLMRPNAFDNQFIKLAAVMAEDKKGNIDVVQPQILYEAFIASYAQALDMCLQGIISPSTLGLDLKKTDNAEAQREKEKATLYSRAKIIDALNEVIPQLVDVAFKVVDTMHSRTPKDYAATVTFGEYAAPDFGSVVDVVAKAKLSGVMSLDQVVEELYGDRWSDEEKSAEILRLKQEQGLIVADEPKVGDDGNQQGEPGATGE